jgi:hypothetical protein
MNHNRGNLFIGGEMGADLGEHEQVLVGAEGDGAGDEDEDAVLGPRGLAVDGVDLQRELLAEEERKGMGQRQLLARDSSVSEGRAMSTFVVLSQLTAKQNHRKSLIFFVKCHEADLGD